MEPQLRSGHPACPREECDGVVIATAKDGRFRRHRGVYINLPRSLVIPRCTRCGRDYADAILQVVIDGELENEFRLYSQMIRTIIEKFKRKK